MLGFENIFRARKQVFQVSCGKNTFVPGKKFIFWMLQAKITFSSVFTWKERISTKVRANDSIVLDDGQEDLLVVATAVALRKSEE